MVQIYGIAPLKRIVDSHVQYSFTIPNRISNDGIAEMVTSKPLSKRSLFRIASFFGPPLRVPLWDPPSCTVVLHISLRDSAFFNVTSSEGFLPICVRKLAWTTSFFVTYERIRVLLTPAPA